MNTPFVNPEFAGPHRNVCVECYTEDSDEFCLANCPCPCHDLFWKDYEITMKNFGDELDEKSHRPI